MKNWGGHFTPELGGHFELESGGHFKLELGGQYHWNLHKVTKKRFLQLTGVYELEDLLDKNILRLVNGRFMELFEGLIIVDCFSPEIIPENDYNKLNKYTNPSYWIKIKAEKSPRVISRLKKDFLILLEKYELLSTKNQIREKLENKFLELIEVETYKKVA